MPLDNPQLDMVSIDVTYADGSYNEVLTAAAEASCPLVQHAVGKGRGIVYVHQREDTEVVRKVFGRGLRRAVLTAHLRKKGLATGRQKLFFCSLGMPSGVMMYHHQVIAASVRHSR